MLSSTLKIRRRALIWYIERLRASDIGYYLAAVSAPYWSGNCHDLMDLSLWSDWDQGGEWIWGARANPVRNLAGPTKWPPFAIASSSLFISCTTGRKTTSTIKVRHVPPRRHHTPHIHWLWTDNSTGKSPAETTQHKSEGNYMLSPTWWYMSISTCRSTVWVFWVVNLITMSIMDVLIESQPHLLTFILCVFFLALLLIAAPMLLIVIFHYYTYLPQMMYD